MRGFSFANRGIGPTLGSRITRRGETGRAKEAVRTEGAAEGTRKSSHHQRPSRLPPCAKIPSTTGTTVFLRGVCCKKYP